MALVSFAFEARADDPAPPAAAPTPPVAADRVRMRVTSESPVTIEMQPERFGVPYGEWQTICSTPCDVLVPASQVVFRATGGDVRASAPFTPMALAGQHVDVLVRPAERGRIPAGIALTSVGGGAIIVGATVALVGAVANLAASIGGGGEQDGYYYAGGGLAAAGVAALVPGILLLTSGKTRVEQYGGLASVASVGLDPARPVGSASGPSPLRLQPPPARAFPVFSVSF
jgi:hypothetical protein